MKLYRVSPRIALEGKAYEGQDQAHLFEEEINAVMIYLERLLTCTEEKAWTASYKEVDGFSIVPESETLQTPEVLDRLRRSFSMEGFWVFRGRSCRFVRVGQDFDVLICLKHDDPLPDSENQGVEVEDISSWLIETDIFDI